MKFCFKDFQLFFREDLTLLDVTGTFNQNLAIKSSISLKRRCSSRSLLRGTDRNNRTDEANNKGDFASTFLD